MRIVHLYPFTPAGRHGGTLRLHAAVEGSARVGEVEIHYFDRSADAWLGPLDLGQLEAALANPAPDGPEFGFKRRLFPSTLWESGIRARRALAPHLPGLGLDRDAIPFLHTSYLAPLLRDRSIFGERSLVDVYDLVWRAHANDAAGSPIGPLRRAYAASVRPREHAALRRAAAVIAAGYEDAGLIGARHPDSRWIPTPTPLSSPPGDPTSRTGLSVGLLGNFAHASTLRGAEALLRSPLAADRRVSLVLAGAGSDSLAASARRAEIVGPVAEVEEFYARVDCVVAPVVGGSGIKCKLGEALLAGRPVLTTALGAAGYPPPIRRHFTVCGPHELRREEVERAISKFDAAAALADAKQELGWDRVVGRYQAAISRLLDGSITG